MIIKVKYDEGFSVFCPFLIQVIFLTPTPSGSLSVLPGTIPGTSPGLWILLRPFCAASSNDIPGKFQCTQRWHGREGQQVKPETAYWLTSAESPGEKFGPPCSPLTRCSQNKWEIGKLGHSHTGYINSSTRVRCKWGGKEHTICRESTYFQKKTRLFSSSFCHLLFLLLQKRHPWCNITTVHPHELQQFTTSSWSGETHRSPTVLTETRLKPQTLGSLRW